MSPAGIRASRGEESEEAAASAAGRPVRERNGGERPCADGFTVAVGFALSATLSAIVALGSSSTRYLSPVAHAIDLALTTSLGVALGVALAAGRAVLSRSPLSDAARAWVGRLAFVALHAALVVLALGDFCDRRAHALALYPLVVPLKVLFALAFALAPLATVTFARALLRPRPTEGRTKTRARLARSGRWLAIFLALGAAAVNGRVHRADHLEIHGAGVWLVALWLAEIVAAWAPTRRSRSRRARVLAALVASAMVAVAFVPPSNRVRLLLFRAPTAVGASVFAALAWRTPPLPAAFAGAEDTDSPAPSTLRVVGGAPLVVLLTIDSMRADVIVGAEGERSLPNFEALARESVLFTNARAAASDSVGSLASLFAGRPRSGLGWVRRGEGVLRGDYPADDASPRVASILEEHGVSTTSLVSAGFLIGDLGVARGFDEELVLARGRARALAPTVTRALLDVLAASDDRPRLVFAHFTDAHAPYVSPSAGRAPARERYMGALAEIDRRLGELREALEAPALASRVILVVVGDHGEPFGEHGPIGRDRSLHDESLRVPLLVRAPQLRAHAVGEPVSLLDLAPTLLDVFGAPKSPAFVGQSLVPLLAAEPFTRRGALVAESAYQRALVRGTRKAILDGRRKTLEIFDVERDPRETENLFPEPASVAQTR